MGQRRSMTAPPPARGHHGDHPSGRVTRLARSLVLGAVFGLGLVAAAVSIGLGAAEVEPAVASSSLGRALHTATRSADGTVLIVGGVDHRMRPALAVILFDPETERFTEIGALDGPRVGHTAHALVDGTVLVIGGSDPAMPAPIDRFDPATRAFTRVGLLDRSVGFSATGLPDGRILIAGGSGVPAAVDGPVADAAILDPLTGTVEPTDSMSVARAGHRATALVDGHVLIHGGEVDGREDDRVAELYDPETGTFSTIPVPFIGYMQPPTVLVEDGRVLIADGLVPLVFDPRRERFTDGDTLPGEPSGHALVALPGGDALVIGGMDAEVPVGRIARWHASTGAYTPIGTLVHPRFLHSATSLDDGTILVVGGLDADRVVHRAELIDPRTGRSRVIGIAPGGDSVARVRQARDGRAVDGPVGMPARIAGREIEATLLDGDGWLALYEGDGDVERDARAAVAALAEAAGIQVADLEVAVAALDARTGRPVIIAAVAFDGVPAAGLIEPVVGLLLGDVLEPVFEPMTVDGRSLVRITDAAIPGAYPRFAHASGDTVWVIDADEGVLPVILRDLPAPDPV